MLDSQTLRKYADVMLWGMYTARSSAFTAGETVLLRYDHSAVDLAEIVYKKLLRDGLNVVQRANPTPGMERSFLEISGPSQLEFLAPGEDTLAHTIHGTISLLAPNSLTHLQDIDPSRIGKVILAKKTIRDILDERENQGHFGWTLGLLPTQALAESAGLTPQEYADQIIRACHLDHPQPEEKWQEIFDAAQEIKSRLNALRIRELHLESENCDLRVTPGEYRRWVGVSGHNIPSFEIFTSPDWRGTQGVFFMDQPSYRNGNQVRNLRLEFDKGEVSAIRAEQGEDFVRKQVQMDENACKLGEFSLTDRRFSRIDRYMAHTLYDENFGGEHGNCHIALGASYAETYSLGGNNLSKAEKEKHGFNDSALHWDLVNTEPKRVRARLESGETRTIYEDGEFLC